MDHETLTVTSSDGRALEVVLAGPADGTALLTHHGTPGSATPYSPFVALGAGRGLRHVSYSRPGYAGSERHEGRSVASCTADVAAILDAVGAERCYTLGWSGGGPHALACAALLGERVIKAATIGGVAPWGADGLDWMSGMAEENIAEFGAALEGPQPLQAFLEPAVADLREVTGEQLAAALGGLASEVDKQAVTGAFAEHLAALFRAATGAGMWGWFDDDLAFTRDWGFDLGAVAVPVTVWQGAQDRMVPFAHGQWLAPHVPGATARLLDEHGHISILVDGYGDILDDLLA